MSSRTRQALEKRAAAGRYHSTAASKTFGDPFLLAEANKLEQEATELLTLPAPPAISAGEIVPTGVSGREVFLRDTLRNPSQVTVDASVARTELLTQNSLDVAALALDAGETVGAGNSLEKMLAHQMAAAHVAAMRYQSKALELLDHAKYQSSKVPLPSAVYTESARLANTAAKMMTVFQDGFLTLQRARSGGKQTVEVRHVTIQAGGQAMIGNLKTGGHAPGAGRKNGK